MRPIGRRLGLGLLVAAAVCAAVPQVAWGIENADEVPIEWVVATGAVRLSASGCSGMLVTPRWVLTAGHCAAADTAGRGSAILGSDGQLAAPSASVANTCGMGGREPCVFPHPYYRFGYPEYDVKLVKLGTPLYPRYPNGQRWESYKRDLYRGDIRALDGQQVDVYGYGATDGSGTGLGILRYAWFNVDSVSDTVLTIDGHVHVFGGDSGSAILTPAQYDVTATDLYRIAGVASVRHHFPFDWDGQGAHAASIAPWFDSFVADDVSAFRAPAQTMTILGIR